MAFVPPYYAKLGKTFKDIACEPFDVKSGVCITTKTSFGLVLKTTGFFDQASNWLSTKGFFKDRFGSAELELDSKQGKVWGKVFIPKILRPVELTVSGGHDPTNKDSFLKEGLAAKAEVEYKRDYFAGAGSVSVAERGGRPAFKLEGSGVGLIQGVALGAEAKLDLDKTNDGLTDYGFKAQYEYKKFLGSFRTEKKATILGFSLLYKHSPRLAVGAELVAAPDPKQTINFVLQEADENTIFTAKESISGGQLSEISVALEQRLSVVTARAVSAWKPKGTPSFAFSLAFGDKE
jgi:hypothetical protein